MGYKLSKLPPNLEYIDNKCNNCQNKIRYEKRIDSVGESYSKDCGNCYRCARKKGCGGYNKIIDKERKIPICDSCNKCQICNKLIFNKNIEYNLDHYILKDERFLCSECSINSIKPTDKNKIYEWGGWAFKWQIIGEYKICDMCDKKSLFSIQSANKCDSCSKIQKDESFNNKWKILTIKEKLKLNGVIKLKILAKNKNLKGHYKLKKYELVEILLPLTKDNDFPIKKRK